MVTRGIFRVAVVASLLFAGQAWAGSDRVKMFIADLSSDVGEVRAGAALALGEAGDRRAVKPLEKILQDEFVDVRKAAAWALGQLGDKASSASLMKALEKDSAPAVRATAATALGQLRVGTTAPALRGALADNDFTVRASSVEALASVSGKDASADAQALLKDENWSVRCSALTALAVVKDPAAVPMIVLILSSDESDFARANAARALGKIGDKVAISALSSALSDRSDKVQQEAASALLSMGVSGDSKEFKTATNPDGSNNQVEPVGGKAIEL